MSLTVSKNPKEGFQFLKFFSMIYWNKTAWYQSLVCFVFLSSFWFIEQGNIWDLFTDGYLRAPVCKYWQRQVCLSIFRTLGKYKILETIKGLFSVWYTSINSPTCKGIHLILSEKFKKTVFLDHISYFHNIFFHKLLNIKFSFLSCLTDPSRVIWNWVNRWLSPASFRPSRNPPPLYSEPPFALPSAFP